MARSTVREALKRADGARLSWPLPDDMTDGALEVALAMRSNRWADAHRAYFKCGRVVSAKPIACKTPAGSCEVQLIRTRFLVGTVPGRRARGRIHLDRELN
jgi:hypothetical protein